MAITKRLIEMMNGTISIGSKKGVGTEVIVSITLRNCERKNKNLEREINPEALNILVVDDNPVEVEHARMVLEEVGIKADTCTSGQEALSKMEMQHAKRQLYNVVFMDWIMPGMNGQETAGLCLFQRV